MVPVGHSPQVTLAEHSLILASTRATPIPLWSRFSAHLTLRCTQPSSLPLSTPDKLIHIHNLNHNLPEGSIHLSRPNLSLGPLDLFPACTSQRCLQLKMLNARFTILPRLKSVLLLLSYLSPYIQTMFAIPLPLPCVLCINPSADSSSDTSHTRTQPTPGNGPSWAVPWGPVAEGASQIMPLLSSRAPTSAMAWEMCDWVSGKYPSGSWVFMEGDLGSSMGLEGLTLGRTLK